MNFLDTWKKGDQNYSIQASEEKLSLLSNKHQQYIYNTRNKQVWLYHYHIYLQFIPQEQFYQIIYVKLSSDKIHQGGGVAAPIGGQIFNEILPYLEINKKE